MKRYYIRVKTQEQFQAAYSWGKAYALLVDYALMDKAEIREQVIHNINDCIDGANITGGPQVFYCMPDAARQSRMEISENIVKNCPETAGILIKSLDELGLLKAAGYNGKVIGDAFLYAANSEAVKLYLELFPDMQFILNDELTDHELSRTVSKFSDELTDHELRKTVSKFSSDVKPHDGDFNYEYDEHMNGATFRDNTVIGCGFREDEIKNAGCGRFIYKIYGHQILMVTNQCISRNYSSCADKKMELQDEKGNVFPVRTDCRSCTGIIYNGKPTYMIDKLADIEYQDILLDFTVEKGKEIRDILGKLDAAEYIAAGMETDHDCGSGRETSSQEETGIHRDIRRERTGREQKNESRDISRGHHFKGVD
ncbi:MAG: hypothetical protein HUJ76_03015 [Parasporobacterium sp.]|nr:hypothetical protein [Parasporobacterium sp.]